MNSLHAVSASKNSQHRVYSAAGKPPTRKIPRDGCAWAPNDCAVRFVLLFLDALTVHLIIFCPIFL